MPGYKNGKIYKILNNIDCEFYVGPTNEALGQIMSKHGYSMNERPFQITQHICMNWL